jgi:hypothetical protein
VLLLYFAAWRGFVVCCVCVCACVRCYIYCGVHPSWCPRGPMDKASAYEAGDCGFESRRGLFLFFCCSTRHLTTHLRPSLRYAPWPIDTPGGTSTLIRLSAQVTTCQAVTHYLLVYVAYRLVCALAAVVWALWRLYVHYPLPPSSVGQPAAHTRSIGFVPKSVVGGGSSETMEDNTMRTVRKSKPRSDTVPRDTGYSIDADLVDLGARIKDRDCSRLELEGWWILDVGLCCVGFSLLTSIVCMYLFSFVSFVSSVSFVSFSLLSLLWDSPVRFVRLIGGPGCVLDLYGLTACVGFVLSAFENVGACVLVGVVVATSFEKPVRH